MNWSISWRNVWRNKLRSIVILCAITLGIFSGVFSWAFYKGMVNQRIQNAIRTEASNIQIHHPDYLVNPDQKFYINHVDSIAGIINSVSNVKAVSTRILINAMITSAETGSGVKIMGIDPDKEKKVTNIYQKIKEGSYFGSDKKNAIVIGSTLAEKLSIKLHSKVVINMQTMDGNLTAGLFKVEGIFKTNNSVYDESTVFVRKSTLSNLINLNNDSGHEIAILLADNSQLDATTHILRSKFPSLDIKTWRQLMPEVSIVESTTDLSMYIFMGIILLALIFGIINTMLMAVLERMKELGMLMAIGMNKMRVFWMIVNETVLLSVSGGILGIALGYLVTLYFSVKGVDLSAWAQAYEKLGYETMVYPVITINILVQVTVMVIITGVLAALYPAYKALQFKPAEALHIDN